MAKAHPVRAARVALVSLGCPKNLVDSERMLALLAEGGCVVNSPMDQADAVVINTCGFLGAACRESMDVIREALAHKRAGRVRRVIVAGCLVNRDAGAMLREAPGIDAVVGVNDRRSILQAVTGRGRYTRVTPHAAPIAGLSDAGRFRLTPRHTAYLRISEGCSRRCTFCTIPAIRGPYRSKPTDMVLREARELIADGAVELNVIGQDTTGYGFDLPGRPGLSDLLRRLDGLDGARWIRLMYAYPSRFSDRLIDVLAGARRVVPYLDLPLQHVNDSILRRMGRGTTRRGIERLLEKLRRRVPGIVLRTTFIVGFPGETRRQFEELLRFVKYVRFDALGVFEFSAESGTTAARMPRQVPDDVKAERARRIMLSQQEIAFGANRDRIGQRLEVLVDGRRGDGRWIGSHAGQAPDIDSVCLLAGRHSPGTFVRGTVTGSEGYDLVVG